MALLFAVACAAHAKAASYPCLIEPSETVKLSTPASGVLRRVAVKRGDRIRKGQLLAVLDSRAKKAAAKLALYKSQRKGPVAQAQAKIKFAQRKFDRLRHMADDHLVAAQKRDDAEAALRQAQAELLTAQENLKIAHLDYERQRRQIAERSIYSPFDGVVVSQSAWPGDVVQPADAKHPILTVARIDPLAVRAILPMSAFGMPRLGMKAVVTPEIKSLGPFSAQVSSIDRIIDAASGSFEVFLYLPNPHFDVPSGIKCQVTFKASAARQKKARPVSAPSSHDAK
jgi:RND family efflux transporter MFP subunit